MRPTKAGIVASVAIGTALILGLLAYGDVLLATLRMLFG
jgi:hypothetical protein